MLFLAGLFIGLCLRNAPNDKKKSEITVFKNKLLLVSLLRLARCVRRLKSLKRFWPYLMSFRATSRPVSLSNYITFDVFFSGFMKSGIVYAVILHTFYKI